MAGCALFTTPLMLVPLAGGPKPLILATLFIAEFTSGLGVMVLDISIGSIFAAVIPDEVRSRVSGAFQAVNYGTRPVGALLGGALGALIELRPALWIASAGGLIGVLLLLPSPLPAYRMPSSSRQRARNRAARRVTLTGTSPFPAGKGGLSPDRGSQAQSSRHPPPCVRSGKRGSGTGRPARCHHWPLPPLIRPNAVSTRLPGSNSSMAGRSSMLPGS